METSQSFNKISFFYENRRPRINKERVEKWLQKICSMEKFTIVDLSYTFCSDESLLEINIQHLNHDYYTDIITFDLSDVSREIEGDIYISVDRVRENAKKLQSNFEHEILRVIVHGLLHLMGYKDKTVSDAKLMRRKEDDSLLQY